MNVSADMKVTTSSLPLTQGQGCQLYTWTEASQMYAENHAYLSSNLTPLSLSLSLSLFLPPPTLASENKIRQG